MPPRTTRTAPLAVLAVASEIYPLVKTGGLADVAGALPGALAAEGIAVTTLVPGYPAVLAALPTAKTVLDIADLFGGPARVLRGKAMELDILALDAPHLYGRAGNPYLGPDGQDWPDNALRFAGLAAIGAAIARGAIKGFRPKVVHAHDWQAGLTAAYLYYGGTIWRFRASIPTKSSPDLAFRQHRSGLMASRITAWWAI
jgi:starch synthase